MSPAVNVSAADFVLKNLSSAPTPSTGQTSFQCSGATDEELEQLSVIKWWTEGVAQVVICVVGICGNSLSVPVLLSKPLNSVFNRLLIYLAVFDNLYLVFSILDSLR